MPDRRESNDSSDDDDEADGGHEGAEEDADKDKDKDDVIWMDEAEDENDPCIVPTAK